MIEPKGLTKNTTEEIKKILLSHLPSKKKLFVYIFGSRSKNTYQKYSDLDLWIEADPPLSAREITHILEQFEESNLAIQIDIVSPETCLRDYLPQIQKEKQLWFSS